MNETTEC